MRNWKTTLSGILLAAGLFLNSEYSPQKDSVWVKRIGNLLAIVGAGLVGVSAKDFNVTGTGKKDDQPKV